MKFLVPAPKPQHMTFEYHIKRFLFFLKGDKETTKRLGVSPATHDCSEDAEQRIGC